MKMMLKHVVAAGVAAAFGGLYAASEVWVDKSEGNDLTGDGTSASPYATIQKGVDEVDAGGTVWVNPGVYDQGERADAYGASNRVYITKRLSLKATGARADTVIKGAADPSVGHGLGPAAIRCIAVTNGIGCVEIHGFTLKNGCSQNKDNGTAQEANYAGGIFGNGYTEGSEKSYTFVYDCTISGCNATRGGAVYNCRLFRCTATGCRSTNVGNVGRYVRAYNCLFIRNAGTHTYLKGESMFAYDIALYNCTVAENGTYVFIQPYSTSYNCMFFNNAGGVGAEGYAKMNNCVTDDATALANETAQANDCIEGVYRDCVYAPLSGDFRIINGSVCDGAGSTNNAAYPTYSRDGDLFGNSRTTDGKLNIGAIEASVDAGVGIVTVDAGSFAGGVSENMPDAPLISCSSHARTAVLPAAVKIAMPRIVTGGYLFVTNSEGAMSFLKWDDTVHLPAVRYVAGGDDVLSTLVSTPSGNRAVWVDRERGDDSTGSASDPTNHPYQSIQAAVSYVAPNWGKGGIVYVRRGVYDNKGAIGISDITNRVWLGDNSSIIRVVAVDGPDVTSIVGASDRTSETGCGPGAVRCVECGGGTKIISGFTLQGGRTGTAISSDGTSTNNQRRRGGAMYRRYGSTIFLYATDCEIKDCTGEQGIAYSGIFVRCRIHDSGRYAAGPLIDCKLTSCLVWDCGPETGYTGLNVAGPSTLLYNTTIGSCNARSAVGSESSAWNSVLAVGGVQDVHTTLPFALKYCLYETTYSTAIDPSAGSTQEGSVKAPAGFRNGADGDFALLAVSQGQGLASYDNMDKGCPVDVNSVPFTGSADGRFEAGAVAGRTPGAELSSSYNGGISPAGLVALDANGEIAVTATAAATRPLLGFEVNGEMIEWHTPTYTASMAAAGSDAIRIKAVYGTEFFVDAVNGKETNSGHYADDAKLYIASAMALTADGDSVVALPGEYGADTPVAHKSGVGILTRVVVPARRTLKSRDGAATTSIVGASATEDKAYGCGTDGVRCVYLNSNSKLVGFTIRDGRTDLADASSIDGDDYSGGGVLGLSMDSSVVEDCVITNCASYRGGGARNVCLRRCRILGNKARWFGSGANTCYIQRCFVNGNFHGQTYACYSGRYESSTFGADNFQSDGVTPAVIRIDTSGVNAFMRNCIFAAGTVYSTHLYNCAFATGMTPSSPNEIVGDIYGEVQLDDGGAPVIGHNVGIDAANEAIMSEVCKSNDLVMCSRIWNGARDMGAIEVDWREHYARSLADRRMTVSDAPESAKEQPDGKIRLVDGELTASWAAAQGRSVTRTLRYSVPGSGTLTVTLDGTVVDTVNAGETKEFVFRSGVDANALSFSYSPGANDELGALLGSFSGYSGMKISFR